MVGADGSASRLGNHVGVVCEQVDLGLEAELAETILATDSEGELCVDTSRFVWQHEYDQFVASVDDNWPRYSIQMKIGDNENSKCGTFLVGRPHYEMSGLIGRGTRGYIAYYVEEKSFMSFSMCSVDSAQPGQLPRHTATHSHALSLADTQITINTASPASTETSKDVEARTEESRRWSNSPPSPA